MKIRLLYIASIFFAVTFIGCSCSKDGKDGAEGGDTGEYAIDKYWSDDYTGTCGIQVTASDGQAPRMLLADEIFYATGVNCFNLFTQSFSGNTFSMRNVESAITVLEEEEVPVVRFSCIPYYASEYGIYFDNRDAYLATLDAIATMADEKHIGLIPSIFWKPSETAAYFAEEYKAWGDKDSRTYAFMLEYTRDIVNTLKDHKSIFAWEFGNEFSLDADISIAGYPELSAYDVRTAYQGFADLISELDPHGRLIASGNSVMRNAQYNLLHNKTWDNDSFDQYVEITGIMTPEPMSGMSEHVYEEDRVFSDRGTVSRDEQIKCALEAAAANGKVYYIGEFTGPRSADETLMRTNYDIYYNNRVQLSLMWNFALRGEVEWSFSANGEMGQLAFSLMREYNEKYAQLSETH